MTKESKGAALLLWKASEDRTKEYIIEKISDELKRACIETLKINITAPDAFGKLEEANQYLTSIPSTKKHFVFSLDADGFEVPLRMDGVWVDLLTHNVFTYLTKHPAAYGRELSGINSWYISILNGTKEAVSYIEEHYPHLDGSEKMLFPYFSGRFSNLLFAERENEILFLGDYCKKAEAFLTCLLEEKTHTVVYGTGWEQMECCETGNLHILSGAEKTYEKKLDYMGQSRVTVFYHESEYEKMDKDVISALANGSLVLTEETEDLGELFQDKKEILFYQKEHFDFERLRQNDLLGMEIHKQAKIAEAGRKKAVAEGDLAVFIRKILQRCK